MEDVAPRRGEVWWHEPPDAKRRPVLVLTRDAAIGVLNAVIVVPATRSVYAIPTHVRLDEGDGMREPCALALDNISAAPKGELTERLTTLGPERIAEVCRALDAATDC